MISKSLEKGDKVYLMSKSAGTSMDIVKKRSVYNTETIMYNDRVFKNLIVGYFIRPESAHLVICYNKELYGGDYYKRSDLVTEKELSLVHNLPEYLFDL